MASGSKGLAIPILLAALASATTVAAEAPLEDARQCALLQDSLQRLTCYDRVFPPALPAVAPPPTSAAGESAKFGADTLKRPEATRKAEAPSDSLTATVREARQTRTHVYRVTLDNDQVWQQMDMDSSFTVEAGDTLRVVKGPMGGYRMSRTSRGGSGWVRASRVK